MMIDSIISTYDYGGVDSISLETELVSVHEAAQMLNVDRSRVNVLLTQGRFVGAAKIGRNWVIPRVAVENFQRLPPGGRKNTKQKQAADRELVAAALSELKGGVSDGE